MRPDRVVIGVETERSEKLMREIYRPLFLLDTPIVKTGIETAELIKYAANSFLAVKISFINEIAPLAEKVGADVFDVAKAMGLDKRIGPKFLHAGLGFGGSCLPKDTNAIVHIAAGGRHRHVHRRGGHRRQRRPARRAPWPRPSELIGDLRARPSPCWAWPSSPTPTTSVRRRRSSWSQLLKERGCDRARPRSGRHGQLPHVHPDLVYCRNAYEACDRRRPVILVTEWNQYRQLDFEAIASTVAGKLFLDCRNVYNRAHLEQFGFRYDCFGRPGRPPTRPDPPCPCNGPPASTRGLKGNHETADQRPRRPLRPGHAHDPLQGRDHGQVRGHSHVRRLHPGRGGAAAGRGGGRSLRLRRRRGRVLGLERPLRGAGGGRRQARRRGDHLALHLRRHHGGHRPDRRRARSSWTSAPRT